MKGSVCSTTAGDENLMLKDWSNVSLCFESSGNAGIGVELKPLPSSVVVNG
jgi:hypothetical protein